MTQPIHLLVTGVAGGSIGEQVFKTLRSGKNRYDILATNTDRGPMAAVTAEHYEVLPPAADDCYIPELGRLIEQYDIQFLIPGSEPELVEISKHRQHLLDTGVLLLINSHDVITWCVDKLQTFERLSKHHIRVPKTIEITGQADFDRLDMELPCIVKPAVGSGGSAATFIAQQWDELVFFVTYLQRYGYRALVQEYIGHSDNEYTIGVLNNPQGGHIGTVVLNRQIVSGLSNRLRIPNHTPRSELGSILAISSGISQGRMAADDAISKQAETIAHILGSTGPLNVQGRWDGEEFVPFEINPRFSGTSPIRAIAGFNEPEILIDWYQKRRSYDGMPLASGEFTRGISEYFTPAPHFRRRQR